MSEVTRIGVADPVVQPERPVVCEPDYQNRCHVVRHWRGAQLERHDWPVEPAEGVIDSTWIFNRLRMTMAFDSRGFDGPWVDYALGVEEPTVDNWEDGTEKPTTEQIRQVATLTAYPVAFFYRPDPPRLNSVHVCR